MTRTEQMQILYETISKKDVNFYHALGLEKTCTETEIKKTYRKLMTLCHPDNYVSETEEIQLLAEKCSQILQKIYDNLIDPIKRNYYDTRGKCLKEKDYADAVVAKKHNDSIEKLFEVIKEFEKVDDTAVIQTIHPKLIYFGGKHTFKCEDIELFINIPKGMPNGTTFVFKEVLGEPKGYGRKGHITIVCIYGNSKTVKFNNLDVETTLSKTEVKRNEDGDIEKVKLFGVWVNVEDADVSYSKKTKKYKFLGLGLSGDLLEDKGDLIVKINE